MDKYKIVVRIIKSISVVCSEWRVESNKVPDAGRSECHM